MSKNLGVLLILLSAFCVQANSQAKRDKHETERQIKRPNSLENPSALVSNSYTTNYYEQGAVDKPRGWHRLITWPEGITAWAIIFTLGAISWQSWETRRAAKAARDQVESAARSLILQYRPRIHIRGFILNEVPESNLTVTVWIVNKGGTPAKVIQLPISLTLVRGDIREPLEWVSPPITAFILAAGEWKMPTFHFREKNSPSLIEVMKHDVKTWEKTDYYIECSGDIRYLDGSDVCRDTSFNKRFAFGKDGTLGYSDCEQNYED